LEFALGARAALRAVVERSGLLPPHKGTHPPVISARCSDYRTSFDIDLETPW
jgi:hypothetical protein